MKKIQSYQPKVTITLFDKKIDQELKGVLYFQQLIEEKPKLIKKSILINKSPSTRWVNDHYSKLSQFDLLKFKTLAIICFMLSVIGFISLVLPVAAAEAKLHLSYLESYTSSNQKSPTPSPTPFNNVVLYYAKDQQPEPQNFSLSIPKINLTTDVFPDVDPREDTIYNEKLKSGVAQARGSYLPGQSGTVFLFGHSTDTPEHIIQYNARFYAVKDLQPGDEINIDYHGKHFTYSIYDKKVTSPFDLDTIRNSKADLILQTCWPPGTDWQRLMVFAKQI